MLNGTPHHRSESSSATPLTLDDIRDEELAEIRTRRKCVGLAAGDNLREDLAGLCLSGGGLRSACFNLGVLQAFWKSGLIRFIDYVSAVSGGSYIGTYLASSAMHAPKIEIDPADTKAGKDALRKAFPFQEEAGHRQTPVVNRLIYGGYYLRKPWALANHYLIGAVFNNIALVSLLVASCALVAILWRTLDFPIVRETARLVHLQSDLVTPFLPFIAFCVLWLISWSVSYFRRGAEAPGQVAVGLLVATFFSLLIALAVLFGNGDISTPPLLATLFGIQSPSLGPEAWLPVILALLTAMLPFFHPKRLLQSGTRPKQTWERLVFAVASTAFLVGVPIIIVALLARENISGYATAPGRALHPEEIRDWDALHWLLAARAAGQGNQGGIKPVSSATATVPAASQVVAGSKPSPRELIKSPVGKELAERLADVGIRHPGLLRKLEQQLAEYEKWRPDVAAPRAYRQAGGASSEVPRGWDVFPLDDWAVRSFVFIGFLTGLDPDNPLDDHWNNHWQLAATKADVAEIIDRELLRNRTLADEMAQWTEVHEKQLLDTPLDEVTDPQERRRIELLRKAELAPNGADDWPDTQVRELNRLQAERHLPNVFQKQSLVQRRVVIHEDQKHRLLWLFGALSVFLVVGLWVDLNATTVHRFYRDRLSRAFIVPREGKEKTIPLSTLKTTARGFPYYLISGTVLVFRRRLLETEQEVNRAVHFGQGQSDPRWTDSFLFSHRYCGSQVTGYLPTAAYERRVQGEENRLDLADATAISGGALSPMADRNWLITFLMLAFNLRLGQWLPNPRSMPPRGRPRFGVIFRSLFQPAENRPYCFVSDGGHCENMGLVQLLRRRCRLIIVSDAACDPRHEFADLANALRVARMHGGVQVLALDPDRDCPDVVCLADLQLIGSKASSAGQGDDSKTNVQSHFVLARIKYPPRTRQYGDPQKAKNDTVEDPEGLDGLLIYFKPSLTGDEDLDVVQYRSANAEFPHEPSNDQFFDANQVEAYRRLGYHIAEKVQRLLPPLVAHDDEKLWNETWDGKGGEFLRHAFEDGWWQATSPRTNVIWTPAARNGGSSSGSALRVE